MSRRVLAILVVVMLGAGSFVVAQPFETDVYLTPDNSEVRLFVSIDGRILEITVPDGGTADPDYPIGTGWAPVYDAPAFTGDLIYSADGNLNFSVPSQNRVGRMTLDGTTTVDYVYCADSSCEPSGLAINYDGDLLAVNGSDSGGLLRWEKLVGICSNGEDPAYLCYELGGVMPPLFPLPDPSVGKLVGGSSTAPGDWVAIQEWYTGELASISRTADSSGPGNSKKGGGGGSVDLNKSLDPTYSSLSMVREIDNDASDLAITQAHIFYAAGGDVVRVDVGTKSEFPCASVGNKNDARYISGDVGGILYVASVGKQEITVHQIDYYLSDPETDEWVCGDPKPLKTFLTKDFGKNLGGLASTYSTLRSFDAIADKRWNDGSTRTFVTKPDGMHIYRYTAECPSGQDCELVSNPTLSLAALAAIENATDPDNPVNPNDSRGLPFNLPGQAFPWEYRSSTDFDGFPDPYIAEAEFHEFATERSGRNFRLSCCPQSDEEDVISAPDLTECEFGALIYALPVPSEIVPDPRGTKRGSGSVCYESLTSTKNAGIYAAEWCGWNSPLVPTPTGDFDVDAFFCSGNGVTSSGYGGNLPVKFDVGAFGEVCTSSNAPEFDLRVLFSAGLVGYCAGGKFVPGPVVEPVLGIMPSGEGTLDPATGQILFAKAGPKKMYHFNFDTAQVPLLFGPVRTIVVIGATFLEDSTDDRSVYFALDP